MNTQKQNQYRPADPSKKAVNYVQIAYSAIVIGACVVCAWMTIKMLVVAL